MNRWLGGIAIAAGFFVLLYAAFAVGRHQGRATEIQSQTRIDAERTLDLLVAGQPELALRLRLLHHASFEQVQKTAAQSGPPTSYRFLDVSAGPSGLPVVVEMEVERKGQTYQEFFIRHGVSSPLDYSAAR